MSQASRNSIRRTPGRSGFTLVELMVVVGVIAILVALLMPMLNGVRQQARIAECLSNLRQIGIGAAMYSGAHKGCTVPGYGHYQGDCKSPVKDPGGVPIDAENYATILYNGGYLASKQVFRCPDGTEDYTPTYLSHGGTARPFPTSRWDGLSQSPWRVVSVSSGEIIDTWYGANAARDSWNTQKFPCRRLPQDGSKPLNWTLTRLSDIRSPARTVFLFDGTWINLYYEADRLSARHRNRTVTNLLLFDGHAEAVLTESLPGGRGPNTPGVSPFRSAATLAPWPAYRWRLDQE